MHPRVHNGGSVIVVRKHNRKSENYNLAKNEEKIAYVSQILNKSSSLNKSQLGRPLLATPHRHVNLNADVTPNILLVLFIFLPELRILSPIRSKPCGRIPFPE
jgi:hypothetical protein